jgi:hypothetical protein
VTTPHERLLDEMAATLRGPRRARQRLLDEVSEDLKDAVEAESAAGLSPDAAEALVAARFGSPTAIAGHWNSDQALRRRTIQRNTLLLVTAMAMAGALGITQYASGKNSPTPIPSQCTQPRMVASKLPTAGGLPQVGTRARRDRGPSRSEC